MKFEASTLKKLTADFLCAMFKVTKNFDFTDQYQDQKQLLVVQYDENFVFEFTNRSSEHLMKT